MSKSINYQKYVVNFGLGLIFLFATLYYVVYARNVRTVTVPGVVLPKDIVHICFYFMPLGILIALAQVFTPISPSTSKSTEFFNRKITTKLFGINTVGKLLFFLLLLGVNFFWWFAPLLMRDDLHEFTAIDFVDVISEKAAIAGMWDMSLSIIFYCRENKVLSYFIQDLKGKNNIDETSLNFHKIFGVMSFALISLHSVGLGFVYIYEDIAVRLIPLSRRGLLNFFGIIAWAAMIAMLVTSIYLIRRKYYKLFFWTHQLYILAVIFAVMHDSNVIYYIIPALLYLVYDKIAPRLTNSEFRNAKATIYYMDKTIVRLNITLPNNQEFPYYPPGSWVNICFPKLSKIDWHPFSITSNYLDNKKVLTIIVASKGKWSSGLVEMSADGSAVEVPVKVNGYFGNGHPFKENVRSLLVAGGTGVSALIPFTKKLLESEPNLTKFVWVVKKPADLLLYTEFLLLLQKTAKTSNFKPVFYFTRSSEVPTELHKQTQNLISENRISSKNKDVIVSETFHKKNYKLAILSLLVFIFGNLGYMVGRWIQPSKKDYDKCRKTYQTEPYLHFACYYWWSFGPLLLSVLFSILVGAITVFVYNRMFNKSTVSQNDHVEMIDNSKSDKEKEADSNQQSDLLDFVKENSRSGRPDFNELLLLLPNNSESEKKLHVYIAGPTVFNTDLQKVCRKNKVEYFVESWEK
ncbi:hypothetical protein HDU92_005845 [Lobulomyces angularis]|nr:hypothetical protein HDU92_005845 [Lobulomyces angularis]